MTATDALGMTVRCIQCGGRCELVNGNTNGMLSIAIVECADCQAQWEIAARLSAHRAGCRRKATQ